jgi:hypothetical protein
MFTKWAIVYILVNGGGFSHQMLDVSDHETCITKGEAWVAQMAKKGYDTDEDTNPTPDYNKWADFECIEMPAVD